MTELPTHMTNVLMLFFKNTHFQYKPLEKKKKKSWTYRTQAALPLAI